MTDFSSEILPTRKIWSDFEELGGEGNSEKL